MSRRMPYRTATAARSIEVAASAQHTLCATAPCPGSGGDERCAGDPLLRLVPRFGVGFVLGLAGSSTRLRVLFAG
jgi:hypothetical protein